MSIYRVNPIAGSGHFKVDVADSPDGLRVVGVFFSEADANAWIASDSGMGEASRQDVSGLLSRPE